MTVIDNFQWTAERWGQALRAPVVSEAAANLFTTRELRLRGHSETHDWALVAAAVGVPAERLVRLQQVHGTTVVSLKRGEPIPYSANTWPQADIVVTDDTSLAVAVQVADCAPLLIADRHGRAVAAVHAGWRGTCSGAAPKAVSALLTVFGVDPGDVVVALGPSIGPCCYSVGQDVFDAFAARHRAEQTARWFRRDEDGRLRLDLWAANADQLEAAGVAPDSIRVSGLCSACHPDLFHSYRRDGPGAGRIAAAIRLRPPRPSLR